MQGRLQDFSPRAGAREIASDVAFLTTQISNVIFLGPRDAGDRGFVLVDAGMPGSRARIEHAAAERFGPRSRPAAIVLTHGHFDHVGAVRELAERWDAPVYAHRLELPYLTGRSAYPPGDPTVGGGAMARLAAVYPRGPIDLGQRVQPFPEGFQIPGLAEWRIVDTPGHSPGHVSLFRERDRLLVVGDAFVTVRQESAYAVLTQRREVHGPPAYFTIDWDAARESVRRLAELRPEQAIAGHGLPMSGIGLWDGLDRLARAFDERARPARGRYVATPARADETGVTAIPPAPPDPVKKVAAGVAAALVVGGTLAAIGTRRRLRRPRG